MEKDKRWMSNRYDTKLTENSQTTQKIIMLNQEINQIGPIVI
jgi:hypothetical protein